MDKLVLQVAQIHVRRLFDQFFVVTITTHPKLIHLAKEITSYLLHVLADGGGGENYLRSNISLDRLHFRIQKLLQKFVDGLFVARVYKSVKFVDDQMFAVGDEKFVTVAPMLQTFQRTHDTIDALSQLSRLNFVVLPRI